MAWAPGGGPPAPLRREDIISSDKPASPDRQTIIIYILAGVAVLLVGGIIGFVVTRDDAPATTTIAAIPSTTSTTVAPTTTATTPITTSTTLEAPAPEGITFTAVEDTMVISEEPETSFADAPVLEVEEDEDDIRRALIGFEVEGLPEDRPITAATLRLSVVDASEEGGLVSLVDGEWSEAETTWSSAPPLGAPIGPLAGGVEGSLLEVDVTSAVTGNGRVDFYLSTQAADGIEFGSRESAEGAPSLVVFLAEEEGESDGGAVLVGAGDIASCASEGDEITAGLIAEVVATTTEAVVFTAGDNAYESGSEQNFADCYDPSWGRFKDITRPAVGSREYRTAGAAPYFEYFGSAAGDPAEGYYSYNLGGWHVVVLNSNCTNVGGCEVGSPQEQWLGEDLTAQSTACTLAYWHQPLFSSRAGGTNPEMLPFYQALFEAEAEIVISGNDHFYERFLPQDPVGEEDDEGINQFTVGTGGSSLDAFGPPTPNSATRFNESFGVLSLTLSPGSYEWEFITPSGTPFTDTGSGRCH